MLRMIIDDLCPPAGNQQDGIDPRAHDILYRYAVAKQSVIRIADQLGISERQVYRELRRAIHVVANRLGGLLEEPSPEDKGPPAASGETGGVRGELERLLAAGDQDVDIMQLLREVVAGIQGLAAERQIPMRLDIRPGSAFASVNRVMLRQALLNLLSHLVATADPTEGIEVHLEQGAGEVYVRLCHAPDVAVSVSDPQSPHAVAQQLLDLMELPWTQREEGGSVEITITIPLMIGYSVLIIEDNQDLVALFKRYLRQQPYVVHSASSGEALEQLAQINPDIVILDVMMPGKDGWEILQDLRLRAEAHRPRVIVCTIINDPQLAEVLGADLFLNKPVTREQLLRALQMVRAAST